MEINKNIVACICHPFTLEPESIWYFGIVEAIQLIINKRSSNIKEAYLYKYKSGVPLQYIADELKKEIITIYDIFDRSEKLNYLSLFNDKTQQCIDMECIHDMSYEWHYIEDKPCVVIYGLHDSGLAH